VHILGFSGSLYKRSIVQENESLIGKVVKIDLQTDKGLRGQFAWFPVQVNLSKPLISKIWITSRIHRIEYESLPSICFQHGRFGHLREGCPHERVEKEEFEEWMVVDRRQRQETMGSWVSERIGLDLVREVEMLGQKLGQERELGRLNGHVLLEYKHHIMVNLKENGSPNMGTARGSRMRSCLPANSGHLKLKQTSGFHGKAVQVEEEYLRDFDLDVVVLIETRASGIKAECVVKNIGLSNSHKVANGFWRGIWIFWKDIVNLIVEVNQFQFVHLKVKFSELNDWFLFIGIYESPLWVLRKELRVELGNISQNVRLPWMLAGGFNAMLYKEENKSEGYWFSRSKVYLEQRSSVRTSRPCTVYLFWSEELYKAPRLFRFLSGWLSHSDFGHLVNENWGNDDKSEGPVWIFVEAVKKWNLE
ncbi:hypothetical protein Gorai_014224, partial [Gossypium raimondii]|nr:hypothetical protein [Gossypium raimondii]